MDLDHELCYCFHVSKRKIVNFARQTRPRRASQLSQCFGAGTGCGWCVPFLVNIHEQVMRGEAVASDDISPDEYEQMRARYRKAVAEGERSRNTFTAGTTPVTETSRAPGPTPGPPESAEKEPFDFTRYFSRSRPDPEPETMKNPDSQDAKGS